MPNLQTVLNQASVLQSMTKELSNAVSSAAGAKTLEQIHSKAKSAESSYNRTRNQAQMIAGWGSGIARGMLSNLGTIGTGISRAIGANDEDAARGSLKQVTSNCTHLVSQANNLYSQNLLTKSQPGVLKRLVAGGPGIK